MSQIKSCEALLRKWLPILRLDDWDWEVVIVGQLPDGAMAQIEWSYEWNWFKLSVIDSKLKNKLHPPKSNPDYALERLVLHELIHLVLRPLSLRSFSVPVKAPKAYEREEERVVNKLVKAFMDLDAHHPK